MAVALRCVAGLLVLGSAQASAQKPAGWVEIPNEAQCKRDAFNYCEQRHIAVELSRSQLNVQIAVNIGVSDKLTLHFPKGLEFVEEGIITGNDQIFSVEQKKNFLVVKAEMPRDAVKVAAKEGAEKAQKLVLGEKGTLKLLTVRGWNINIELRVWHNEISVSSVRFTSSELANEEMRLEKRIAEGVARCEAEKKDIEADVNERADQAGKRRMAQAVLQGISCVSLSNTKMTDLIWVHQDEVCRLGALTHVRFVLRNRSAERYRLGTVEVLSEDGEVPVFAVFQKPDSEPVQTLELDEVSLGKNQEVVGAVVLRNADHRGALTLRLREQGGMQRIVEVGGIVF